jgi:formylglycine-generating enzyme required for sulfatase activity
MRIFVIIAIWFVCTSASAQDMFRDCESCPWMVSVSPGAFYMGAIPNVGHDDERAKNGGAFQVSIRTGLAVSVGEVTRAQFSEFLKDKPDYKPASSCAGLFAGVFSRKQNADWMMPGFDQDDRHPVVCVRWQDAFAYAQWLSEKTGQIYRLLSEAEWEYVARAGSLTRYWWGNGLPERVANCLSDCQDDFMQTAPALSMTPNPFGLYHMSGNVWEWTQDCYVADAYRRYEKLYPNPVQGNEDCHRVIRGGSWVENAWSLRSSNREGWRTDVPLNDLGFRVAREGWDQGT